MGVTAMVCSRAMFWFFDDPEGPNLLIVTVMAAVVYFLALVINSYFPLVKEDGYKKILSTIFTQIIIVSFFYILLSI